MLKAKFIAINAKIKKILSKQYNFTCEGARSKNKLPKLAEKST